MLLVVRKQILKYNPGGPEQFKPVDRFSALKKYLESPSADPIAIESVSIAVIVSESRKYFECEVMHNNIVVPDTRCMFYVTLYYPWRLITGVQDSDTILTNGTNYYLASRPLAKTPFKLNDYSKSVLVTAITNFVGSI